MKHEDADRRRPGVACLPVNRSAVSAKRGNVLTGECRRCLSLVHVAVGIGEEKKKKKNKQKIKERGTRGKADDDSEREPWPRKGTIQEDVSLSPWDTSYVFLSLSLFLLVSLAKGSFELYVHDFVSVRFTGVEFVAK